MRTCFDKVRERQLAAAAIEARVQELAAASGVAIAACHWNLGQEMTHSGPHRLDVDTGDAAAKISFTDFELLAYRHERHSYGTETRLQYLVRELQDNDLPPQTLSRVERLPQRARP